MFMYLIFTVYLRKKQNFITTETIVNYGSSHAAHVVISYCITEKLCMYV